MNDVSENTCCFCGKPIAGEGNDPYPITTNWEGGRGCCDDCFALYVAPMRNFAEHAPMEGAVAIAKLMHELGHDANVDYLDFFTRAALSMEPKPTDAQHDLRKELGDVQAFLDNAACELEEYASLIEESCDELREQVKKAKDYGHDVRELERALDALSTAGESIGDLWFDSIPTARDYVDDARDLLGRLPQYV